MKSDIIFKGTKVDGIYDKDPLKNNDAKKISKQTKELVNNQTQSLGHETAEKLLVTQLDD